MKQINWQDFTQVELRAGTIIKAEIFKEALKPAYILHVDFGDEIGIKKSSAQITGLYKPQDLVSRQVMAVVNFPPKQIGPVMSECLVTGFYNQDGHVVLAVPDQTVPNGSKLV